MSSVQENNLLKETDARNPCPQTRTTDDLEASPQVKVSAKNEALGLVHNGPPHTHHLCVQTYSLATQGVSTAFEQLCLILLIMPPVSATSR